MIFNWPLFLWYFRSLQLMTVITSITAAGYVASRSLPLNLRDGSIAMFILAHCLLIACLISPSRSDVSLFLFSQGFSRQTLWLHSWLAALASVGLTLAPCAVLILFGIRGWIQGSQMNPWFPLIAPTEIPILGWAVVEYLILLPILRYVTIRLANPDQEFKSAFAIFLLGFIVIAMVWSRLPHSATFQNWTMTGIATISAVLTVLGYTSMKRTEAC